MWPFKKDAMSGKSWAHESAKLCIELVEALGPLSDSSLMISNYLTSAGDERIEQGDFSDDITDRIGLHYSIYDDPLVRAYQIYFIYSEFVNGGCLDTNRSARFCDWVVHIQSISTHRAQPLTGTWRSLAQRMKNEDPAWEDDLVAPILCGMLGDQTASLPADLCLHMKAELLRALQLVAVLTMRATARLFGNQHRAAVFEGKLEQMKAEHVEQRKGSPLFAERENQDSEQNGTGMGSGGGENAPTIRPKGDADKMGKTQTCPECGKTVLLQAPPSTFYAICPECRGEVYMGP